MVEATTEQLDPYIHVIVYRDSRDMNTNIVWHIDLLSVKFLLINLSHICYLH